MSKTNI